MFLYFQTCLKIFLQPVQLYASLHQAARIGPSLLTESRHPFRCTPYVKCSLGASFSKLREIFLHPLWLHALLSKVFQFSWINQCPNLNTTSSIQGYIKFSKYYCPFMLGHIFCETSFIRSRLRAFPQKQIHDSKLSPSIFLSPISGRSLYVFKFDT